MVDLFVLEGLGHYGGKGMVMFMVTEPYHHMVMDEEAKRVQEVWLGYKISRSALVAYFLRQGFSLPNFITFLRQSVPTQEPMGRYSHSNFK